MIHENKESFSKSESLSDAIDGITGRRKKKWAGERVFVNPPYGREVVAWIKKGFDLVYVDANRAELVVFLLPVRTDTDWFHRYIYNIKGVEIRFLRDILEFEVDHAMGQRNTAPFPSMIVVFRRHLISGL